MVDKKGYMKTLEAVFAVILLLIVAISIVSINKYEVDNVPHEIILLQDTILESIQGNETLREYVYNYNLDEGIKEDLLFFVDSKIDSNRIAYSIIICEGIVCEVSEDKFEDVYADSLILHQEETNLNYLVRLYLWYNR